MTVRFTLTLKDIEIDGKAMDQFIIDWTTNAGPEEIKKISKNWISAGDKVAHQMVGLTKVGGMTLNMNIEEQTTRF